MPRDGRRQAAASTPVQLFPWNAPPEKLKLDLHGLEFANERLRNQALNKSEFPQMTMVAREPGMWTVAVEMQLAEQPGRTRDLAAISSEPSGLEFRWSDSEMSPDMTAARAWLRTCVFELEIEGVQTYLALALPAKLDSPHLINGETLFTPQEIAGLSARLFDGVNLGLSSCTVNFGMRRLTLIAGERPANAAAAAEWASASGVGGVQVRLKRDEKKRESWRLWLEIDPPASLLDLREAHARQQGEYDSLKAELAAYSKEGATANRKLDAVRSLADLLDVKFPEPSEAGANAEDQANARLDFEDALEKLILTPARKRRDKLQTDLRQLRQALSTADAQFTRKAGDLRARADSISAVLTRNVDDGLDVVCVVLGDPEPIPDEPADEPPASQKPQ
ncbi:MAG TPA: hypothetical protein VHB99_13290 [Pirellulales bacterium]|nr:hypothetical protein [Pirellulales bacterium]